MANTTLHPNMIVLQHPKLILAIIEACGMTPEKFFYNNIKSYDNDKKILNLLNKLDDEEKQAIITLLQKRQ